MSYNAQHELYGPAWVIKAGMSNQRVLLVSRKTRIALAKGWTKRLWSSIVAVANLRVVQVTENVAAFEETMKLMLQVDIFAIGGCRMMIVIVEVRIDK